MRGIEGEGVSGSGPGISAGSEVDACPLPLSSSLSVA
jgi:hypothetical protein